MKGWEINYNNNKVTVENRWFGERLYVNGELQDELIGVASRARLWGKLSTGEEIKVTLGGIFKIHCRIFIDQKLVSSD
ncbi:hypothetical protein [Mangrovibacillus cuniculi]|uniref:Uncharacterized protein n=1 Tax=Mangrovibacillus cuniculi TaxID=2593652 RepID=A0A7S8C8U3_9BACI|nr:hypothetical protein [Mangrovibacillus cuniculi]QPC45527.1 hypothetical protein G8O30_00310 [Mangrovibacillus cuniculi]